MDTINTPKILCGDLNLRPDTESMRILEHGMNNLITEYSIQSTRTRYYTKPEKFADYILTSPEILINEFRVMPEEVSDHCPLYLDFIYLPRYVILIASFCAKDLLAMEPPLSLLVFCKSLACYLSLDLFISLSPRVSLANSSLHRRGKGVKLTQKT